MDVMLSQSWRNVFPGDIKWGVAQEQTYTRCPSAFRQWLQERCADEDMAR